LNPGMQGSCGKKLDNAGIPQKKAGEGGGAAATPGRPGESANGPGSSCLSWLLGRSRQERGGTHAPSRKGRVQKEGPAKGSGRKLNNSSDWLGTKKKSGDEKKTLCEQKRKSQGKIKNALGQGKKDVSSRHQ